MLAKQKFYGWYLLAVLFALDFVNMGFPYYGGTVINGFMIREIPMSRGTLGLGFTLLNLAVGLSAVVVAALLFSVDRRITPNSTGREFLNSVSAQLSMHPENLKRFSHANPARLLRL